MQRSWLALPIRNQPQEVSTSDMSTHFNFQEQVSKCDPCGSMWSLWGSSNMVTAVLHPNSPSTPIILSRRTRSQSASRMHETTAFSSPGCVRSRHVFHQSPSSSPWRQHPVQDLVTHRIIPQSDCSISSPLSVIRRRPPPSPLSSHQLRNSTTTTTFLMEEISQTTWTPPRRQSAATATLPTGSSPTSSAAKHQPKRTHYNQRRASSSKTDTNEGNKWHQLARSQSAAFQDSESLSQGSVSLMSSGTAKTLSNGGITSAGVQENRKSLSEQNLSAGATTNGSSTSPPPPLPPKPSTRKYVIPTKQGSPRIETYEAINHRPTSASTLFYQNTSHKKSVPDNPVVLQGPSVLISSGSSSAFRPVQPSGASSSSSLTSPVQPQQAPQTSAMKLSHRKFGTAPHQGAAKRAALHKGLFSNSTDDNQEPSNSLYSASSSCMSGNGIPELPPIEENQVDNSASASHQLPMDHMLEKELRFLKEAILSSDRELIRTYDEAKQQLESQLLTERQRVQRLEESVKVLTHRAHQATLALAECRIQLTKCRRATSECRCSATTVSTQSTSDASSPPQLNGSSQDSPCPISGSSTSSALLVNAGVQVDLAEKDEEKNLVNDLQRQLREQEQSFSMERALWLKEKRKVIQYQMQLQESQLRLRECNYQLNQRLQGMLLWREQAMRQLGHQQPNQNSTKTPPQNQPPPPARASAGGGHYGSLGRSSSLNTPRGNSDTSNNRHSFSPATGIPEETAF